MRNIATTRILFEPERRAATSAKAWLWPLPRLDGVAPSIVGPIDATQAEGLVELGYPDRASSTELVPVFAPQDGAITYATRQQGGTVCLDHPGGWSTVLGGLETVLAAWTDRFSRRRKSRVRAGDVLGYVCKTLRVSFGLSRWEQGAWATIDPAACCHAWTIQPWFTSPTPALASGLAL